MNIWESHAKFTLNCLDHLLRWLQQQDKNSSPWLELRTYFSFKWASTRDYFRIRQTQTETVIYLQKTLEKWIRKRVSNQYYNRSTGNIANHYSVLMISQLLLFNWLKLLWNCFFCQSAPTHPNGGQVNMESEISQRGFISSYYCLSLRSRTRRFCAPLMIYDFRLALCLHSVVAAVTVHIPPFVMALY